MIEINSTFNNFSRNVFAMIFNEFEFKSFNKKICRIDCFEFKFKFHSSTKSIISIVDEMIYFEIFNMKREFFKDDKYL